MPTEELYRRFHDELLAFVRRRVPGEEDAEEVVQQVFLQIHRRLQAADEPRHPRGWVYQVTRNALVDHFRRRVDRTETLASETAEETVEHAEFTDLDLSQCMRPLLATLPQPYRQAIEWTDLQGVTQSEAARRAGVTVAGMKSRVQRGRVKLKEALLACCRVELDRRRAPMAAECVGQCECPSDSSSGSSDKQGRADRKKLNAVLKIEPEELCRQQGGSKC
jgi:RNA polymerase sigma-70 factor (ECF subfamily)